MSLQVPAIANEGSTVSINVSEAVFGSAFNETLVHQLVTRYLAGARSGTKGQKNRSDVKGGGAKPWRQKGTGRARAGTMSSPLWRTGGVTFAANPRSFEQKMNKKMFKIGIRSIFSELLREDRLLVNNDICPSSPKTKELLGKLPEMGAAKTLIIVDNDDNNLVLASRNLPNVEVITPRCLNPVLLVASEKVIVTEQALKLIEEQLQ